MAAWAITPTHRRTRFAVEGFSIQSIVLAIIGSVLLLRGRPTIARWVRYQGDLIPEL